jgi:sigma-B regulation protein RsbU (phosphoserine phosphatase)
VLVVDDNATNRRILCDTAALWGMRPETAEDGPSALRRLRRAAAAGEPFRLVLLDVMMPGMDGLEVLREIRRTYAAAQLPVIMVTALDRSEDVVAALNGGANDYVTKPLDFPVVLARVRTHAALKQAVDHVRELERWLAQRNQELQAANVRMRADLDAAGKVQAALLPSSSPAAEGYRFAWLFNPSTELAGDIFNVFRLDDRYLGMYVLDVSGHGVAAALLSVTVSRFLFPVPDPTSLLWERTPDGDCRIAAPARVAERLGERFPFDDATGQYFTVVYGLLDLRQHRLSYVSAGHPAIVRSRPGQPPAVLPGVGFPVGVAAGAEPYEEHVVDLAPGDRLYLYSDGVPETMNPAGETFGTARFLRAIADHGVEGVALDDHLDRVAAAVCQWSGADRCQDDQTILCVERDRG